MIISSQLSKNYLYLVRCHAEGLVEVTRKNFVGGPEGNEKTRGAIRKLVNDLVELCDAVERGGAVLWPTDGPGGQS